MKLILINSITSAVFFALMDSLWFAVYMKHEALDKLAPILRLKNGNIDVNFPSVILAYFLMVLVAVVFLVPKVTTIESYYLAFFYGAIMGLCVFGVYDFTNMAILKSYSMKFVLYDVLWGAFMYGCLGTILTIINSNQ
jgi:uncharacterized membrane protein